MTKNHIRARICLLAIALVMFAQASQVTAQDIKNWQLVAPENEEFSVLMPEMPKIATSDVTIYPDKDEPFFAQCTVYVLVKDGMLFSVQAFATDKPKELAEKLFDHKSNPPSPALADLSFTEKQFIVGKHLYLVRVAHREVSDPRAKLFLQSFSTNKPKVSAKAKPKAPIVPETEAANAPPAPVFKAKEVTRKAVILARPAPSYTHEARKNEVVGTVVVRVLLSATGRIEQANPVVKLPDNLTEQAVNAAKLIIFLPAEKDGKPVSQWVQVEYAFNLY